MLYGLEKGVLFSFHFFFKVKMQDTIYNIVYAIWAIYYAYIFASANIPKNIL